MADLSELAFAVLERLKETTGRSGQQQPLTVSELTDLLAIERHVLDGALAELDEAGLVRVRGATNTSQSSVRLVGDEQQTAGHQGQTASP